MNFKNVLFDSSRKACENCVELIGEDEIKFKLLFDFILENVPQFSPRGVRVFYVIDMQFPHMALPYLDTIIKMLPHFEPGTQRGFIKVLSNHVKDLKEEQFGYLLDFCFDKLKEPKAKPAQIVYSMEVLHQMVIQEPLLKDELIESIQNIMPYSSSAVQNSGQKIIAKLKKL